MATLTVQVAGPGGITPNFQAVAAGGDDFPNNGRVLLEIVNASGSNAYTLTITTSKTAPGGVAIEDPQVSIPTSGRRIVGPFAIGSFGSSVALAYAGSAPATDLTVALYKI